MSETAHTLTVTYDDDRKRQVPVSDVLGWRTWKISELSQIDKVTKGDLRRFSTRDEFGDYCDLEAEGEKE